MGPSAAAAPGAAARRPPEDSWDVDVEAVTSIEARPDGAQTVVEVRPSVNVLPAPLAVRQTDPAAPTEPPPPGAPEAPPQDERPSVPPLYLPAICKYGRYDLLGRLALGGMAEIFLAREDAEGGATRYLVLKRILPHVADDEGFIEMFLQEARVAMRLSHPNICHIYEFGQEDGTYFIAMEWVNGVPLGKLIRRARTEGGVPIAVAVKVIAQVAEALQHAHTAKDAAGRPHGIIHRDVTPHNVMVSYDGVVKLLDFGIAKAMDFATKTQAGVVKGKFAYMSPQQCRGEVIDGRADIFSLGVCLYETLTGEPLFHRQTQFETMRAVVEELPPSVRRKRPDCPPALDAIVQMSLAKNPDHRFATAAAMQDALEQVLADSRQYVSASKISTMMHAWYADEIQQGPLVDTTPFGSSFRRVAAQLPPMPGESEPPGPDVAAAAAPVSDLGFAASHTHTGRLARARASRGIAWWIGAAVLAMGVAAVVAVALFIAIGRWRDTANPPVAATRVLPAGRDPPQPRPDPTATSGDPATTTGAAGSVPPAVPGVVPPPAAATGALSVRSTPPGATIRIGERTVAGLTPIEVADLEVGRYLVTVERSGFEPWRSEVEVRAGERRVIDTRLTPLPRERPRAREPTEEGPPGTLSINTRPWSKVYVGSRLLGTTPIGNARVPSGVLRLRLVDRDNNTHSRTARVPPGGSVRLFFDLTQSP